MTIGKRIKNFLISIDQLGWTIITLGGGYPDETISSATWRYEQQGNMIAKVFRPIIDILFFFEKEHCYNAYVSEIERWQAPRHIDS
jgi:hypothetical protein